MQESRTDQRIDFPFFKLENDAELACDSRHFEGMANWTAFQQIDGFGNGNQKVNEGRLRSGRLGSGLKPGCNVLKIGCHKKRLPPTEINKTANTPFKRNRNAMLIGILI
jgi:hypothetical protein